MGAREFPGSTVLGRHSSIAGGTGSIPGRGTKMPECHPAAKKKKSRVKFGGIQVLCGFSIAWGGGQQPCIVQGSTVQ